MGVGAIGAVGTYQPYVYNTNTLSRSSLNPIGKIDNNVSKSHFDNQISPYAGETLNPLEKGETANYADVLNSQMQMGMNHAARLFGDDSVFTS